MRRFALALVLLASTASAQTMAPVLTNPQPANNTDASSTIAVTNTFQSIFAASSLTPGQGAYRAGCVVLNTGVNTMWVYEGAIAGATKAKSFPLSPAPFVGGTGGLYRCAEGGTVNASQVSITGTAGDAFVANQGGGGGLLNLNPTVAVPQPGPIPGSGTLVLGATTTAAPTYTNNTVDPLSLTTSGELRVKVDAVADPNINVDKWGGAATTLGQKLGASSIPTVLASDTALPTGANIIGQIGIDQTTPGSTNGVTIAPTNATAAGITSVVSGSAENSHVLKNGSGVLYSVYAQNLTSTSGFLVVTNTTSAPGDGAITPLDCVTLPGNGFAEINFRPGPTKIYSTGITAVLTSSTTCFTKTTGVITGFISGDVK